MTVLHTLRRLGLILLFGALAVSAPASAQEVAPAKPKPVSHGGALQVLGLQAFALQLCIGEFADRLAGGQDFRETPNIWSYGNSGDIRKNPGISVKLSALHPRYEVAQEEAVINDLLPRLEPEVVHCNDWMTGLVPAVASRLGIKSLFTLHNIHSLKTTVEHIEKTGIDCREFWGNLYYDRMPQSFDESSSDNYVDFLPFAKGEVANRDTPVARNSGCGTGLRHIAQQKVTRAYHPALPRLPTLFGVAITAGRFAARSRDAVFRLHPCGTPSRLA